MWSISISIAVCLSVPMSVCLYARISQQASAALTDPRDAVPHAHRVVHMSTVSVVNWWPTIVTRLLH